jgi:hypothetical protein
MKEAKIFQLNYCDWWAGYDLESVMAAYRKEMTEGHFAPCDPNDDIFDEPHELSDADMERLKFVDGDDPINADGTPGGTRSFREELRRQVERGDEFPCFFASTEY